MNYVQELLWEQFDVQLLDPSLVWLGLIAAALVVIANTVGLFMRAKRAKRLPGVNLLHEAEKSVGGRWRKFAPVWLVLCVLGTLALGLQLGNPVRVTEIRHEASRSVLALDNSLSTLAVENEGGKTVLENIKELALYIVDLAREGDEIALVIFADEAVLAIEPTSDKEKLRQVINDLQPDVATDLGGALFEAHNMVRLSESKAHVIIISDGAASTETSIGLALTRLNEADISVSTSQVGSSGGFTVNEDGLRRTFSSRPELMMFIADETGGEYIPANDRSMLSQVFTNLERSVSVETQENPVQVPLYVGFGLLALAGIAFGLRGRIFG